MSEQFEKGVLVGQEIMRNINRVSDRGDFARGIAEAVFSDHRTLQQGFGNILLEVIEQGAIEHQKGHMDLRNQSFLTWCRNVVSNFPGRFPFI